MTAKWNILSLVAGLGCLAALPALAIVNDNQLLSYQDIVQRNAFALKPANPPVDPNANAPTQQVNITFTGITGNFGVKKAYFRIPDAAKPGQFLYPCIREGERDGALEVVSVDEKAGSVRIKNAGTAMTLTFETHGNKVAGPLIAGAPAAPGVPMLPGATPPGMPTPLNRPAGFPAGFPAGSPPGAAGTMPMPMNVAPPALQAIPSASVGDGSGSQSIPLRSVRTLSGASAGGVGGYNATSIGPQPSGAQKSLESDVINLEIQRALHSDKIARGDFPPLPPTDLTQ